MKLKSEFNNSILEELTHLNSVLTVCTAYHNNNKTLQYLHREYVCIYTILRINSYIFPKQLVWLVTGLCVCYNILNVYCILTVLSLLLLFLITIERDIYNYIPETNHVSRLYIVVAVLY